MAQWKYYNPRFECDQMNEAMLAFSPWAGHRNFAYDLIAWMKPAVVVELGCHYGSSTFAFLQAVKDLRTESKFYGVDTWHGDRYTCNGYEHDHIFEKFKAVLSAYYSSVEVSVLRSTFDEARPKFENALIDILHIDGSHDYKDVWHDFNLWKDRVSEDGIILLHDISDDVFLEGEKLGSGVLWDEIKMKYPYTTEFHFSCGLGILFLSEERYQEFMRQVNLDVYQRMNDRLDTIFKDRLRKLYFREIDCTAYVEDLKKQLEVVHRHLQQYKVNEQLKNEYISNLEYCVREKEEGIKGFEKSSSEKDSYILHLEQQAQEKDIALKAYGKQVAEKDAYIAQLEQQEREKDVALSAYGKQVAEKGNYIRQLEQQEQEKDDALSTYGKQVAEKDAYIVQLEQQGREKDDALSTYGKQVAEKDAYIAQLERQERDKDAALSAYEKQVAGKDAYIAQLERQERDKDAALSAYEKQVAGKDAYIAQLERQERDKDSALKSYDELMSQKDAYIRQLEERIEGKGRN